MNQEIDKSELLNSRNFYEKVLEYKRQGLHVKEIRNKFPIAGGSYHRYSIAVFYYYEYDKYKHRHSLTREELKNLVDLLDSGSISAYQAYTKINGKEKSKRIPPEFSTRTRYAEDRTEHKINQALASLDGLSLGLLQVDNLDEKALSTLRIVRRRITQIISAQEKEQS